MAWHLTLNSFSLSHFAVSLHSVLVGKICCGNLCFPDQNMRILMSQ